MIILLLTCILFEYGLMVAYLVGEILCILCKILVPDSSLEKEFFR